MEQCDCGGSLKTISQKDMISSVECKKCGNSYVEFRGYLYKNPAMNNSIHAS
jgi:hypothetical protein